MCTNKQIILFYLLTFKQEVSVLNIKQHSAYLRHKIKYNENVEKIAIF